MSKRKRYARPKGKRFFPVTITLTEEEIAYLNAQPNASEVIRNILDDLIQVRKDVDANLGAVILNKQLGALQGEEKNLYYARKDQLYKNEDLWQFTIEEHYVYPNGRMEDKELQKTKRIVWEDEEKEIPKPTDDAALLEQAQIALKVLGDYDRALASVRQRIQDIKKRILQGE
jgi:hypothetical protein